MNIRLLTPSFHPRVLDRSFGVFCKNADILCQVWLKELKCCQSIGNVGEINVTSYTYFVAPWMSSVVYLLS